MDIYLFSIVATLIVVVIAFAFMAMVAVVDVVVRQNKSDASKMFITGVKDVLKLLLLRGSKNYHNKSRNGQDK